MSYIRDVLAVVVILRLRLGLSAGTSAASSLRLFLLGLHIEYISKYASADVYLEESSSLDGVVSGTTMVQDLVEHCP